MVRDRSINAYENLYKASLFGIVFSWEQLAIIMKLSLLIILGLAKKSYMIMSGFWKEAVLSWPCSDNT
jgi:hypothetical protein